MEWRMFVTAKLVAAMVIATVAYAQVAVLAGNAGDGGGEVVLIRGVSAAFAEAAGVEVEVDYGGMVLGRATSANVDVLSLYGAQARWYDDTDYLAFPHAGYEFDLATGEPQVPPALEDSNARYVLVKLIGPPAIEWRETMAALGAPVVDAAMPDTYIVRRNSLVLEELRALPFVHWVAAYQPAYKIQQRLNGMAGVVPIIVSPFAGESAIAIASRMEALGATIIDVTDSSETGGWVQADIDASLLPQVAAIDAAEYVFYRETMWPMNDKANNLLEARSAWYFDTSGYGPWPPGSNVALTGYGQVVGVTDTGFDTGSANCLPTGPHYDFCRGYMGDRLIRVAYDGTGFGDADDENGHGTAVAGDVLANGFCKERLDNAGNDGPGNDRTYVGYAGLAPEARLSFSASAQGNGLGGIAFRYPNQWDNQYNDGARVLSNSWGGAGDGTYGANSNNADAWMFNAARRSALLVIAAGNDGPTTMTVGSPGTSKNALTVGAIGNDRTADARFPSSPCKVSDFSARGPTQPGWGKPDVMAPGESVITTKSTVITNDDFASDVPGDVQPDTPNGITDYQYFSGTSAATPLVAGAAAVVRHYYVNVSGLLDSQVSSSLVKATLINGAVDMGYGYPYDFGLGYAWSYDQGWGRVNLRNSLFPDPPRSNMFQQGMLVGSGQVWDAAIDGGLNVDLVSGRVPLKVTLVWLDSANQFLINNLDLILRSPSGQEYHGNQFLNNWSADTLQLAGYDSYNTVENVFVETPETGLWEVEVFASTVGFEAPFAIVISGDFGAQKPYNVVLTAKSSSFMNGVAGGSAAFVFNVLNFGTNADEVPLSDNAPAFLGTSYLPTNQPMLASSQDVNVTMSIAISLVAPTGLVCFTIEGISLNDPSGQAKDSLDVCVEVLDTPLPRRMQVTDLTWFEGDPNLLVQNIGGEDHIWISYLSEELATNGKRVFIKHSTWTRLQASQTDWDKCLLTNLAEGPEDPRILRLASGRVLVYWHGSEAVPPAIEPYSVVRLAYTDTPVPTGPIGTWCSTAWTKDIVVDENSGACQFWVAESTRRIVLAEHGSRLYAIKEILGYSGFTSVATFLGTDLLARWSDDGGVTWPGGDVGSFDTSHCQRIGDGGSMNTEFFPHVARDTGGTLWVIYYERVGLGPSASRDLYYRKLTSGFVWQARTLMSTCNSPQNDQFPFVYQTDEGSPSRTYALFLTERYTTVDWFKIVSCYTDNGGTTWTAPAQGFTGKTSQSGYTTGRDLVSAKRTADGTTWAVHLEESNAYGTAQVNLLYTTDGFASASTYKVTADPFGKGHPVLDVSGNNVYVAWSASIGCNSDIWLTRFNLTAGADILGPLVNDLNVDRTTAAPGDNLVVSANLDDTTTGFSDIATSEYWWDDVLNPHNPLAPADGAYNAPVEAALQTVSTAGLTPGLHTLHLRGQDVMNNWGPTRAVTVDLQSPCLFPPEAPTLTGAYLDPLIPANVILQWTGAIDEGVICGTTEYRVWRALSLAGPYSPYASPIPLGGPYTWTDAGAGDGDLNNYFYRVYSVGTGGDVTAAAQTAAKFVRAGLPAGRSLVSAPVTSFIDNPPQYFASLGANLDAAWTFRAVDAFDPWKSYSAVKGGGDFQNIDFATGFWVDLAAPDDFAVAGLIPVLNTINLQTGYNLVSFPSFSATYTVGDLKAATGASRVQAWSATAPYYLQELPGGTILAAGQAYWVRVPAATTWSP